jgi:hypothetical protein
MKSNIVRDVLIVLVALGCVFLYTSTVNFGFPLDDSWIHQTFGRNLAQYGEWSFLVGQPVAASTSPLYTILLSIGYRLNVNFLLWTHGMGAIALALIGLLGARMVLLIKPESKYLPLLMGLTLVMSWHIVWAASAGMETAIFCFFTLWLVYLAWREPQANPGDKNSALRGLVLGISVALTTLARPEGIVLGALVGLTLLILRPHGWRSLLILGVVAVVSFALLIAPNIIQNLQLTGGIFPNTATAKWQDLAGMQDVSIVQRWLLMFESILPGAQIVFIPFIAFYLWQLRQSRQWWLVLPIVWAVVLIFLYAWRLPAPVQHGRYVLPALPSLIFCGLFGFAMWVNTRRWRLRGGIAWNRLAVRVLQIVSAMLLFAFLFVLGLRAQIQDVTFIQEEIVETAWWVRDNLPNDELLALNDIGAIGYFTGRTDLVDVAGLITPDIIPLIGKPEEIFAYMQERDAKYFMGFVYQIPNDNPDDPRLCKIFESDGTMAPSLGERNMAVYRIAWDRNCQ